MKTNLPSPISEVSAAAVSTVRAPQEQQAGAQVKALKKRKAERVRFFFGWCQGCRALGNSF